MFAMTCLHICLNSCNLRLDPLHLLLLGQLRRPVLLALLCPMLLAFLLTSLLILLPRILADRLVSRRVHLLQPVSLDVIVDIPLELALVALLVVVSKGLHVFHHMPAEDVFAQGFGVELFGFNVVAREAVFAVRDEDASIACTFHGTENTRPSGGTRKADVEETFERTTLFAIHLRSLRELVFPVRLLHTRKVVREIELAQGAASDEEADSVGGSPVRETVLDAVALKFMTIGGHKDLVAGDLGGYDLAYDVAVGEADDEAVFGSIVLVLRLRNKSFAGIVVGFAGTAAFVLDLVAAGVYMSVKMGISGGWGSAGFRHIGYGVPERMT